jgi:Rho GTPase-activating protein RGD1
MSWKERQHVLLTRIDSSDTASPQLDFRNPENFFHDVNSVAGLLKQFFRDLPDPLLTKEHYSAFIEAASKFCHSRSALDRRG